MVSLHFLLADDLNDALAGWHRFLTHEKVMSAHTIRAYMADISHFLTFLSGHLGQAVSLSALSETQPQDFRGWLATKAREGTSARSRARSLSALKSFFAFLDKRGIMHNPYLHILGSPKIGHNLPRAISKKQAQRLIDLSVFDSAADFQERRDQMLFLLLYGCGLRISEALNLNIGDVPGSGDVWRIMGKGRKQRIVPNLPIIEQTLAKYLTHHPDPLNAESPLFLGQRGGRLNQGMAQKALRQIRASHGFPDTLTPHALRHSYATHLLANGANLREIQELLGHASLSSTQIYADVENAQILDIHRRFHPSHKKKDDA